MREGGGCSQTSREDCGEMIQKGPGLWSTYGEGMGRQHPVPKVEESSSIHLPQGAHDGATLARSDLLGCGMWAPNAATPSLGVFHGHYEDPPYAPASTASLYIRQWLHFSRDKVCEVPGMP